MPPKKTMSPGPVDRMPEILKLIAEPTSVKNKKKPEVTYYQDPDKEVNHDYCDACAGGGEIICCDKCPRSFHITCHYPRIYRLPIGDWFCSGCAYIDNDEYRVRAPKSCNFDIDSILKKVKDYDYSCGIQLEHMTEIPIKRKYNIKPNPTQFDKTDRCCICKRGYLKAQLVRCHSCSCCYHLNCMDPPIRDWDNGTRWICPAHNKFYELMYPDYFPPGSKTVSDREVLKRLRCEVPPTQPVNSYFKIPSHIDAMYKKPEEKNIPVSNSLNILCDVASFELKSLNNSNLKNNENTSNDVTEKFLASQHFNKFQNINVLPKQPNAYLTCLTLPIEFLVKNEPITIGKSRSNHLCLEKYENCRFIADHHATITFDEILGDFLVKNHSIHGIIVDNVSYYGHCRTDQKKILTYITKFLNKRRIAVRKHRLFHVISHCNKKTVEYISEIRSFNYASMYQYYSDEIRETEYAYQIDPCKCLKRHIPIDGYTGEALLRDESLISIGCLQFKFKYNKNEVTKMWSERSATKQCVTVEDQSLNEPCLRMLTEQDNCTSVLRGTETEIPLITIDDYESNTFIKQNHISTFSIGNSENIALSSLSSQKLNEPCLRMLTEQDDCSSVLRSTETEIPLITIDDYESNIFIKQNHISKFSIGNPENIALSSLSSQYELPYTTQWSSINNGSGTAQLCNANDLIQVEEVSDMDEDEDTNEDGFVCTIDYTETDDMGQSNGNIENWVIEEDAVLENGNHYDSNEPGPSSANLLITSAEDFPVRNSNDEHDKTEHERRADTQTYNDVIVISSDDEDYEHVENPKSEE